MARRGPDRRHRPCAVRASRPGAPSRRRSAPLLRVVARLECGARLRRLGRTVAFRGVHDRCWCRVVVRRSSGRGPSRSVDSRDRDRGESVRDSLRDRDAHVRARDLLGFLGDLGVSACARIAEAGPSRAVRRDRRAVVLHAVLGAVPTVRRGGAARRTGLARRAPRRGALDAARDGGRRDHFRSVAADVPVSACAHWHAVGDAAAARSAVRLHAARLRGWRRARGLAAVGPVAQPVDAGTLRNARPTNGESSSTCTPSQVRGGRRSLAARRSPSRCR